MSYIEDGMYVYVCFLCGGGMYICVLPRDGINGFPN